MVSSIPSFLRDLVEKRISQLRAIKHADHSAIDQDDRPGSGECQSVIYKVQTMEKLNVFTLFKKYTMRNDRDATPLLMNSAENGVNCASGEASPSLELIN